MKRENPELEKAKQIFSHNLREYMRLAHKEQADIVADLKITASTVSDWYNGKKYARVDKMQRLADYLGVSLSDLRDEKPDDNIISVTGMVPLLGVIPAGIPILAEENIEGYMPTMVKNPEEYFYLRVRGESMKNAGIPNNSLVLIHKQTTAENGQVVACRVNTDEATLKRFKQVKDTVILMPENPDFQPILVSCKDFESGYAEIIGVVKQVTVNM